MEVSISALLAWASFPDAEQRRGNWQEFVLQKRETLCASCNTREKSTFRGVKPFRISGGARICQILKGSRGNGLWLKQAQIGARVHLMQLLYWRLQGLFCRRWSYLLLQLTPLNQLFQTATVGLEASHLLASIVGLLQNMPSALAWDRTSSLSHPLASFRARIAR